MGGVRDIRYPTHREKRDEWGTGTGELLGAGVKRWGISEGWGWWGRGL